MRARGVSATKPTTRKQNTTLQRSVRFPPVFTSRFFGDQFGFFILRGTNDVTPDDDDDDDSPIETPAAGSAKRARPRRRPDMNRIVRFSPYPGDGGDGLTAVLCGVNAVGSAGRSAGRRTGSGPQVGGGLGRAADGVTA